MVWNATVDFQNPEASHPVQRAYIYGTYAEYTPADIEPVEGPVEEPIHPNLFNYLYANTYNTRSGITDATKCRT
jgi:hypothetical protein